MEKLKSILKNKKAIAIAVVVVIIIVVVVVRKRKNKDEGKSGNTSSNSVGGTSSFPTATFPLRPYSQVGEYSAAKGSYGNQIAKLQSLCNSKYGKNLTVDGKWGPKTDEVFKSVLGTALSFGEISEAQYYLLLS